MERFERFECSEDNTPTHTGANHGEVYSGTQFAAEELGAPRQRDCWADDEVLPTEASKYAGMWTERVLEEYPDGVKFVEDASGHTVRVKPDGKRDLIVEGGTGLIFDPDNPDDPGVYTP